MKRIIVLTSCILLASVFVSAQTKLIAHRSHSGKNKTFSIYSPGNFGLPPAKDTVKTQKDTLKTTDKISGSKKKKAKKKTFTTVAARRQ